MFLRAVTVAAALLLSLVWLDMLCMGIVSGVSRNMCILFVVCPVIIGRIWVRGEGVCMVSG